MSKKITYIKTSSLTRKFSQLAAAFMLSILALNLWFNVSNQGQAMLNENATILANNILMQTSHSAKTYIESDNIEALNILTDSALESDYIYEMIIYDHKGIVLSKSDNAIATKARFMTELNSDIQAYQPAPFVKEIRDNDNSLLGFVRITVLTKHLQSEGNIFIERISSQIILLLFIAALTGYLLTVGLRPFSNNAYYTNQ